MTKRILFVDDEPMVLRGIERSLRSMRHEWHLEFLPGGPEALEAMARQPFDVVITDMRMPGMDGAQLLEEVKARFPRTVRMALSGQSDQATILRALGPTHQYLSKPCDVEDLQRKLRHALALRDLLHNPTLKEVVSRLEAVPSLPSLHAASMELLQSSNASITDAGNIIARDLGMTAKVLQLVNSAFLGTPSEIMSAQKGTSILGIDTLRGLMLSVRLFIEFEGELSIDLLDIWEHGLATATLAQAIARSEGGAPSAIEASFTAGLLHDIGKLVLASACREDYEASLRCRSEKGISTPESEYEIFGATHAQVGSYLLGLWGLPLAIVEAVAWHHEPSQAKPVGFGPLIAVHAAGILVNRTNPRLLPLDTEFIDEQLLMELGLEHRLQAWSKLGSEMGASH